MIIGVPNGAIATSAFGNQFGSVYVASGDAGQAMISVPMWNAVLTGILCQAIDAELIADECLGD